MSDDLSSSYFAGAQHTGITLLSRRHWDVAAQAEQRAESLRAGASSAGMEAIQQAFADGRRAASRAGDGCYTGAEAAKESSRAYAAFHRGTPTPDEIASARADHADAVEAVRQAALADRPTAALCEIRDAARRHLDDLRYRRAQAIAELERALNRVLERLRSRPDRKGREDVGDGSDGRTIPGTPLPTPPRGEKMPMPLAPGTPGPGLRTAPPATPPQTAISSTHGPSADALQQLLARAAKPQGQPPMTPIQQPAMQMPAQQLAPAPQPAQPAAPAGARDRKRGALDSEDLDELLDADEDKPGLAAAAVTAPRPAPAGSLAPAAPTPTGPAGTSADGLSTRADPSGRPTPPAGAFAASPATSLSGSHIAQATMAGPGTGTAPAAHPAGHPMGAPMGMPGGAGAGGGSGSSRPPVLKHQGLDHGQSEIGEAVDGGTIAQRKDRDDPPRR